jgi:hypothetical protein
MKATQTAAFDIRYFECRDARPISNQKGLAALRLKIICDE